MRFAHRSSVLGGLLAWTALACLCQPAAAFFPFGGTDQVEQVLRIIRWPLNTIDTNRDGGVTPGEGIPITVEQGLFGFTEEETEIIEESFQVWEDVSTSFIAFRFTSPVTNPLEAEPGSVDGVFYIALDNSDAGENDLNPDNIVLDEAVLGVTVFTFTVEDGFFVTPDGVVFPVTGGQFIDSDIVINADSHRPAQPGAASFSLLGTMVHEVGHFLGLGHTPLNNLNEVFLDRPAVALRGADGVLRATGATPTMFPFIFPADDEFGNSFAGQEDLAPDDIAGVSFLYPRGNQQGFFTIFEEARTQTRTNFPSSQLLGGHIVAWADTDNNPITNRVPLISTITGLYQRAFFVEDVFDRGRFALRGLPKQLETVGGAAPFQVSYTLTNEPITPFTTFGTFADPAVFDSTHARAEDNWGNLGVTYNTLFPTEVFHETEELFSIENRDVGTALFFDSGRGRIVSAESGRSLSQILSDGQPMFGDPSDVCPLNLAVPATLANEGPTAIRGFRDRHLLTNAFGAALSDVYYRTGPYTAGYLKAHDFALESLRSFIGVVAWTLTHRVGIAMAALGGLLLGIAWRLRRSKFAAASVTTAVLFLALCGTSQGLLILLSDSERVDRSDNIVQGEVVAVEPREQPPSNRILTDVTVAIDSVVKGRLNKGASITLTIPGGQVGSVVTVATEFPTFREGDEVILYLSTSDRGDQLLVGGIQGRQLLARLKDTGELAVPSASKAAREKILGSQDATSPRDSASPAEPAHVLLDDYLRYLKELVRE